MNEQKARELLMDYLYDEISAADKKKLEDYLENHPEMREELDQLDQTRSLLQQMPDAEAGQPITFIEANNTKNGWGKYIKRLIPTSAWARTALATAASVILLLITAAMADVSIHSTQSGFSVYFGDKPPVQTTGLTDEQTDAIIQKIQQENTALMTEYADMLNKHNRQQLQQVVEYFERQRLNDLQLIDQALNQYQEETDQQITQTQQVLGEVLQTMAANN